MEAKPLDRRVQRTRRALHQALADLILEKRYDKITIQDIIDRANVGRSTFYTHFLDKEDLLEKGFVMFSDDLAALFENADHTQEESEHVLHSLIFFRHAGMHHELYRAMLEGGGAEVMMDAARRHLKIDIESHLGKLISDQPAGEIPQPVVTNFLAGAMLSLLLWWLDAGRPYPPEAIDAMFQRLAMEGVGRLLTGPNAVTAG